MRLWATQRPDVVHVVTEGPLGWSALQAARHLRLPVVSDFRTNFHAYSAHYGVGWLRAPIMAYLRKFHNRCHSTMVPTDLLRRELAAAGFERLRVVARGVDTQRFTPARRSDALRAQLGRRRPTRWWRCASAAWPPKRTWVCCWTPWPPCAEQHAGLRLVLVGDGPERARLQQRCPEAVFSGLRHGDDLAAHYASADVFLFPSMTETFGNVVPEAMASGLPVVAFDHAAAGQLIRHGDNGLLARLGEASEFCRVARRAAADRTGCARWASARATACCRWTGSASSTRWRRSTPPRWPRPACAAPRPGSRRCLWREARWRAVQAAARSGARGSRHCSAATHTATSRPRPAISQRTSTCSHSSAA